jgi:hypothetical protein
LHRRQSCADNIGVLSRNLPKYAEKISYKPGFDLDKSLKSAQRMANCEDTAAHSAQVEFEHESIHCD